MASNPRKQLEEWLKTIKINKQRVIDIGGSQFPLNEKRLCEFNPKEYVILDLPDPHICKREPDIVADVNYHLFNHEIAIVEEKWQFHFDVAFMIEVLEYCWNPWQTLWNVNRFLNPGGIFYLSTHWCYPIHKPVRQDAIRFTKDGIKKLLEKTGFRVNYVKNREMTNFSWNRYIEFIASEEMKMADGHWNYTGNLIKCRKI